MKRKIFVPLILILCILLSACSTKIEPYNLVVTNNSDEGFKNISIYEKNTSNGVTNADNSLIKPKEEVHMNISSNKFIIRVTDENNKEFKSEEFNVDFDPKDKKIYNITINKNSSDSLEFTLK